MNQLLPLAVLICQLILGSSTALSQTTNIKAKIKAPRLAGLHYVFDASESMCGYLSGDSAKNPLLSQIKMAVSAKNPEIGNRIYLLKQATKDNVDARRDIVEAPANLQTLAEQIKGVAVKKAAGCQPFNGVGSNIELIFAPTSPTQDADAILLVTDAQLVEKDREKFVQGFASWMRESLSNGGQPFAGVALVETEFSGRYFPVSPLSSKRPPGGYLLGTHNRPLLMFWLAKSDKHLAKIQEAVSSFAPVALEKSKDAFTQHLLPTLSLGSAAFQIKPDLKPPLSTLLGAKPKLDFQKYDKSREDVILSSCLHTSVAQDRIVLEVDAKCRDGKPFFDGVSAVNVSVPITPNKLFNTVAKPPNDASVGAVSLKLTSKSFGAQALALQHTLARGAGQQVDARTYSLDSDACDDKASGPAKGGVDVDESCTARLAAKTYQLDVLMAQLFERQGQATAQLLAPLNNMKYVIEFRQKK